MVEEKTPVMFTVDGSQGVGEVRALYAGHGWEVRFKDSGMTVYNAIGRIGNWVKYFSSKKRIGNNNPTDEFYRGCRGEVYLVRRFEDESVQQEVKELEERQASSKEDWEILMFEYLIRERFGYPLPVIREDLQEYCVQSIEENKKGLFRGKKVAEARAKMDEMEDKLNGTRQYYEARYIYFKEKDGYLYEYGYDYDLGRRPSSLYHSEAKVSIPDRVNKRNALPIITKWKRCVRTDKIDGMTVIWGDDDDPTEVKESLPL